jgi:hypothetical protein
MAEGHWSTTAQLKDDGSTTVFGLFDNYEDSQEKALAGAVILFLFLSMTFSTIAIVFSCGYPRQRCHCIRHNSIGNVLAVICCVLACSFWYWFIHKVNLNDIESESKPVTFGFSYYILVAAGICSVIASAFNLFQSKPLSRHSTRRGTGGYSLLSISAGDTELPSPPAYAP